MEIALPSILAQSPAEVLIADDGSKDDLPAYLDTIETETRIDYEWQRHGPH